ncbi:MAG: translation initiation factor IF-2 [Candidatus Paceibacterota bacterium]
MKKEKEKITTRPPVVVIMGHVDHGKSSILESIKDLKITEKESGGITQHIGAYEIEHEEKKITFIDTPGHEAFSLMRARGTRIADIAVLVVAADEGVKKQTEEAISHIKKAKIPFVVAINKIDKQSANPEKVKLGLAEKDILVEDLGGKIPSVNVSATTKQGIKDLLDMILLLGDLEDLRADLSKNTKGVVIESRLDSRRGPAVSVIIAEGILKKGENIRSLSSSGKVKIMENFKGEQISEAYPSMPVLILGFDKIPSAGEEIESVSEGIKMKELEEKKEIFSSFKGAEGKKMLNLIIKADVLGSLEALEGILRKIPSEKVAIKIIKAEAGNIDESDIKLAKGTNAKIIGFRTKTSQIAESLALREKIRIINFEIIYEFEDAIRNFLLRLVEPELIKKEAGKIKILEVFKTDKKSQVIGGKVLLGEIKKNSIVDIIRNNEKIGEGKISGLQKNKKNAGEVLKGEECGMLFQTKEDVFVERGDILVAYTEEKIKGEL